MKRLQAQRRPRWTSYRKPLLNWTKARRRRQFSRALRPQTAPLNAPVEPLAKGRADSAAAPGKVTPYAGEAPRFTGRKEKIECIAEVRARFNLQRVLSVPPSQRAQTSPAAPAAPQSEARASSNMAVTQSLQSQTSANSIAAGLQQNKQAATLQAQAGASVLPEVSSRIDTGARKRQNAADLKTTESAMIQATAPFGSTVWRMGKNGRIERSADAGETWVLQASPSQEEWLAGAAVSDTVCWVAGRKGSIARTADGESWEHIAPPAQVAANGAMLPDWTGITARDAQSATITASDGRKFSTADGGKTWQRQ